MIKILIVCDNINEISKLKRSFGDEYKVSASNSAENALNILQNKTTDIALFHAGADISRLFAFYRLVRQNPETENQPIIFVVEEVVLNIISDTITLEDAEVVVAPVSLENIQNAVDSLI